MLKTLFPLLCLGLSACGMIPNMAPSTNSSSAAPDPTATPTATSAAVASTANAAAAVGTAVVAPTPMNIANAVDAVSGAADAVNTAASSPSTPGSTTQSGSKTVTFDTAKKLEYVDVYVDMGDPTGMRALVPYLMKPKDWMLVGCDLTSGTSKHYRFMKVSTADGKELPSVDLFKPGR